MQRATSDSKSPLPTLRTDAPLVKRSTLRWRGPTPAFAAWAEKMKAPRLLDRVKGFASRGSDHDAPTFH